MPLVKPVRATVALAVVYGGRITTSLLALAASLPPT